MLLFLGFLHGQEVFHQPEFFVAAKACRESEFFPIRGPVEIPSIQFSCYNLAFAAFNINGPKAAVFNFLGLRHLNVVIIFTVGGAGSDPGILLFIRKIGEKNTDFSALKQHFFPSKTPV